MMSARQFFHEHYQGMCWAVPTWAFKFAESYAGYLAGASLPSPAPQDEQSPEESFSEEDIRRNGLSADVFGLIHDLAYDHEGRERFQYRTRAQAILRAASPVGSADKEQG